MNKWLEKRVQEVLRKWRHDEIGYSSAVRELVGLGWNAEYARVYLATH